MRIPTFNMSKCIPALPPTLWIPWKAERGGLRNSVQRSSKNLVGKWNNILCGDSNAEWLCKSFPGEYEMSIWDKRKNNRLHIRRSCLCRDCFNYWVPSPILQYDSRVKTVKDVGTAVTLGCVRIRAPWLWARHVTDLFSIQFLLNME